MDELSPRVARGFGCVASAPPTIQIGPMSDRKAILARIRALSAKTAANGCTEAEAATARAKARDIMAKHQVSDAELVEDEHEPIFDPDLQAYNAARA